MAGTWKSTKVVVAVATVDKAYTTAQPAVNTSQSIVVLAQMPSKQKKGEAKMSEFPSIVEPLKEAGSSETDKHWELVFMISKPKVNKRWVFTAIPVFESTTWRSDVE